MKVLTVTLAIGAASAVASAQQKPDFTGRWVLIQSDPAPATDAQSLDVTQSLQGQPPGLLVLTVTRKSKDQSSTRSHQIGLIGGRNYGSANGRPANPNTTFSVRWDGDSLVIAEGTSEWQGQPARSRTEVWSLDSAGTLTIQVNDDGRKSMAKYQRN